VRVSERWLWVLLLPVLFRPSPAHAQIDPVKRELIQFGYNQPIVGQAPLSGYAFYYYNQPGFLNTNLTLRLAIAPVYLDSELGIRNVLGTNTDIGIGLAGGGYADSYYEVQQGKYLPAQSFDGYGGILSGSVYHLFNPTQLIPLNGVLRGEAHYASYVRDDDTDPNFTLPQDLTTFNVRTGLRLGGMEPLMLPDVAMELSVWYEGQFRENYGYYGYPVNGTLGDRQVEAASHLFWGRALFAYTLPKSKQNFMVSLTAGTSSSPDRFSAYRLGGLLPLASEFPLSLPGYYYQEISASRFALLNGNYSIPLDAKKRWSLTAVGSVAVVDYLPGLAQPGQWNSGVGGGITYRSTSGAWQAMLDYGYGFQAIRDQGRGGQSIGILIQLNLIRTDTEYYNPAENSFIRGMDRFIRSFN
jgi:hypothetical protein